MKIDRVDLSIIIVNWNTREMLAGCLRSIEDCRLKIEDSGDQTEVIVVDNGSADGSAEMVSIRFPWVQLIKNSTNAGFARANNQGMAVAQGRYVLLLNSDTFVLPGALRAMADFMDAHPDIGALGPQLLNEDGSKQGSYADFPTLPSALLGTDFRHHARPYPGGQALEVDAISGACMMVRRETVEAEGGMDEEYRLFVEEVDWCYRIRKAGWLICHFPGAQITHLLGRSRRQRSFFSYLNLHRSRLLFFAKYYGRWPARILRGGYVAMASAKTIVACLKLIAGRGEAARSRLQDNQALFKWLLLEQDVLV